MYFRITLFFSFLILFVSYSSITNCKEAGKGKLKEIGNLEGELSIIAWPGYVERGETDPRYDWVSSLRKRLDALSL